MGGVIGMGNICKPMAVSFQCMTKSTTNKKKEKRKKNWVYVSDAKYYDLLALIFENEKSWSDVHTYD